MNTKYIAVKRDDLGDVVFFVGGRQALTYRGEKIYDLCYGVENKFTWMQEENPNIMEWHVMSSKTHGKFGKVDNPSSEPGRYAWMRVVLSDGTVGDWVFVYADRSAADCAHYCAYECALNVRANAAFRRAVLSAADGKQNVKPVTQPQNQELKKLEQVDFSKLPKSPIELNGYRILVEKVSTRTK